MGLWRLFSINEIGTGEQLTRPVNYSIIYGFLTANPKENPTVADLLKSAT